MSTSTLRPVVTELRLSAFKAHSGAAFALGPLTLFTGASGSGKSSALEAYAALSRLAGGEFLESVFPDPAACVPRRSRPDPQGRRGFRIGCTVDGPVGEVRLDLAVQAEPELRVVGERLTAGGETLLETALRDPGRRSVQAAWHTAGTAQVTRAPLPDDRLATALLPLRIAGKTAGQLFTLAAAEQVLIALRAVFSCDPRPERMRVPAQRGEGRLRSGCDNLASVLLRTRTECATRHAALVAAVRAGCTGPVHGLGTEQVSGGSVRAVLEQGELGVMPIDRLGDGELRYLALALVLMTGPGVLEVDPVADVLPAQQALTVLADGFDRCMDGRQARELLDVARRMCARGHIRLVAAVGRAEDLVPAPEAGGARPGRDAREGVTVVHLGA
ncbi:AAA family ATPase [Streptomyces palmae]|uniref:ATP-binding protein n=1 Tax=Streptomyces palmae TaxID=1701085 RepID=A0A4Z0HA48_9ACTN|nr:ATP-binding protein [Streptomyces palmae]TGB06040.1 ATP-binding protein [Streptomyces palmae]